MVLNNNAVDVFCHAELLCLRKRCFRTVTQTAGPKPCATADHGPAEAGHYVLLRTICVDGASQPRAGTGPAVLRQRGCGARRPGGRHDVPRQRPEAPVKQTIEVGVRASEDKTRRRPPPRAPSLARAPWY